MEDKLLVFDPGKTTGYAIFADLNCSPYLKECGDFTEKEELDRLFGLTNIKLVLIERVSESIPIFDNIVYECEKKNIPYELCEPNILPSAKIIFFDNKKLKNISIHSFEAICHGVVFLYELFGKEYVDELLTQIKARNYNY